MLIIPKDNQDINQMLKRYKRKYKQVQMREQLRERKFFTKKSVKRRHEIQDAAYRDEMLRDMSS